ncbi:MAG TPA: SDR family oxidoreductase [Candidatus Methanoperedens sp.]|nr:SDR family oxidoreductase [Candidatus Methanoperedens sp.]HLB70055.1 SDR family oxidoreductase [Candidatus Methanoperedens sp.]
MTLKFEGKVSLVTGGGSGIGRATALAFAREGAKVIVADVSEQGGKETVQMIEQAGGDAIFIKTDVSDGTEVMEMVNKAIEVYSRIDCAVNNAGVEGMLVNISDYPEEMWNRVIGVNLTGVWLCMKYEIPQMLKQGGGVIINMASIFGLVGLANASAYIASKHGVVGLTKAAALEYSAKGIRVNAVCPGFIETPMLMERSLKAGENPEVYQQIVSVSPIGRLGKPEEIAETVLWLCSDGASFVTGHSMVADGGYGIQ